MVTFSNGLDAVRVLKTHLQARLDSDYSAVFAPYKGVKVVVEDDEPTGDDQAGKPLLLLAMESDVESQFTAPARPRRDVLVRCDATANDFSGAQTGAANPEGSDTKLARALLEIIAEDYDVLKALGLMHVAVRAERETISDSEGVQYHANPHRISWTYRQTI